MIVLDDRRPGGLTAGQEDAQGGARVRAVCLEDLPAVWSFCTQFYDVYRGCSFEDFRAIWCHRWLENPAAGLDTPRGWILETDQAQVVGFYGVVAMRLKIGSQVHVALCGANWVIHPDYRRHGSVTRLHVESGSQTIFRQYLALSSSHVLLSTGIAPAARNARASSMQQIPVDQIDRSLWWIINPRKFLALKSERLGRRNLVWRVLATAAPLMSAMGRVWSIAFGIYSDPERRILPWFAQASIAFDCPELPVELVTSFDGEFDSYWSEYQGFYDVTIERTSAFLNWRHRLLPRSSGQSFVFACRKHGKLLGYIALQTPGTRSESVVPDSYNITDLFYPPEREDVLGNLMNTAFKFAVERDAAVLKISGFHPRLQSTLMATRPHVIDPQVKQDLARGQLGKIVSRSLGLKKETSSGTSRKGSYWYQVPDPTLSKICSTGSWWPSGIDGTGSL